MFRKRKKDTAKKTIFLAAGGTGGHLFPALALGDELTARGISCRVVTDKRGHGFASADIPFPVDRVNAATFKPGLAGKLTAAFRLACGVAEATALILKHKPAAIVGFGGYPSFPTMMAAQMLGVPTILHEQNGVLGKANEKLARGADVLALSCEPTKGVSDKLAAKAVLTGNPVRTPVRDATFEYVAPRADGDINLFIMGGSQGARVLSEIVPAAVARLPAALRARVRVTQQARPEDMQSVTAAYGAAGVTADVQPFFKDVVAHYSRTHVFIGRSGASTVAEIAALGVPAIFIPLMHADRQQVLNAEHVTRPGGGWLMLQDDVTPEKLAAHLQDILEAPEKLSTAAGIARQQGRKDAVKRLADAVLKVAK